MSRLAPVAALLLPFVVACSDGEAGMSRAEGDAAAEEAVTPPAVSPPAPASVGGLAARRTDVDGVVADLLSADRKEGRLTVALRFRNMAGEPRRVDVSDDYDERWRLVAGGRNWSIAREADGEPVANDPPDRILEPAQSALWRGAFVAPPPGVDVFRLEVPGVRAFEDVPIRDAE